MSNAVDATASALAVPQVGEASGRHAADEPLPAYSDVTQVHKDVPEKTATGKDTDSINSSLPPESLSEVAAADSDHEILQDERLLDNVGNGPDVDHPFAFPEPPPYRAVVEASFRPVAIPQILPYPDVGFLPAYPPSLLAYGVPEATWTSFVATLSGFLDASVSQHAVQHAAKIGRSYADVPKALGKGIYADTKSGLQSIGRNAKRGNIFGMIGPTIGVPLGVVGRTIGSIVSLPSVAMQRPDTPRKRADVYIRTANKEWLNPRGLHGRIVSTAELADITDAPLTSLIRREHAAMTAQEQMDLLRNWHAVLRVTASASPRASSKGKSKLETDSLSIGDATLWLMIDALDVSPKSKGRLVNNETQTPMSDDKPSKRF